MYTIGTGALKFLASQVADPAIGTIIEDKLVAYVGSSAERLRSTDPIHVNQYTIFFEVPHTASGQIVQPITTAMVYNTIHNGTFWQWNQAGTVNSQNLLTSLTAASGWNDVLYAVQRGNIADRSAVPRIDGLLYYARDIRRLSIWDKTVGQWVDF